LNIKAFDFHLPKHLIAQKSVKPVDSSKLLYISEEEIKDYNTFDLVNILKPGDLLIANNTKVIKSRVIGQLGQKNISITMLSEYKPGIWQALVKGSKKLGLDDKINLPNDMEISVNRKGEGGLIYFDVSISKLDFINYLNMHGELPLPPYIKTSELEDSFINYQTLFAKNYGAVAAPTAGLHFTKNLKNKLKKKSIDITEITLHVGAGTFLPILANDISKHNMHSEYFSINKNVANKINSTKKNGGRIITIGTTVLRALESTCDEKGQINSFKGETSIFISPGYKVKTADYLLTNFHLPKSTLFILVCAYAGIKTMQKAYQHAINENYRFYSLGDACLIKKANIY
jgi:S-adenosylmethionine:tRNA ribosyltransferase-isomerase